MNSWITVQSASPAPGPDVQNAERSLDLWQFAPFILIAGLFYFILIAPQRKQQKVRDEMLKNIKKNDHVLTQGGIYAIVQSVKDSEVVLTIDEKRDVRIRVARSSIIGVEKVSAGGVSEPAEAEKS